MSQSPVAVNSRPAGMSSAEKKPYKEIASHKGEELGLEMPAGATMKVESSRKRKRTGGKPPKDPSAPKKATTAFFFFSHEERPNIRAKNPDCKVTEISKELGKMWRAMSDNQKEKFVKMAVKDKKRYEEEKAAYENNNRVSQGSGEYEEED